MKTKMRKCIVWGIGAEYNASVNVINYEIGKGNIKVEALVARPEDISGRTLDGFPIIVKENIIDIEFDYLIVMSSRWYNEIYKEAAALGVPVSKILNGGIFKIPLFDFGRYISLIENPITILSDDCWGGMLYRALFLRFNSPTINIWWRQRDSYCKFICDLEYYLKQPLEMKREGDIRLNYSPIGKIGEGEKEIELEFSHNLTFYESKQLWDKRKARVNCNNIFVKMGFDYDEDAGGEYLRVFDRIPYKKICFYSGKTDIPYVVYLKRFEKRIQTGKTWTLTVNYNDFCRNMDFLFDSIDVLKMLNGEDDYIRED